MPSSEIRDTEIHRMWAEDSATLETIAQRFSLTRERVRQILIVRGAASSAEIRERRRNRKQEFDDNEVAMILAASSSVIAAAARQAQTRGEVIESVTRLHPGAKAANIEGAIDRSGAKFVARRVFDSKFSDLSLQAALYFCAGAAVNMRFRTQDFSYLVTPNMLSSLDPDATGISLPSSIPFESIVRLIGVAEHLKEVEQLTPLSSTAYDKFRLQVWEREGWSGSGASHWPPTHQTIQKRLGEGFWKDATRAAGFPESPRKGRDRGPAQFSTEQYARAIADFVSNSTVRNLRPSVRGYELWRKELVDSGKRDIPSAGALRTKFGSWAKAIAAGHTAGL